MTSFPSWLRELSDFLSADGSLRHEAEWIASYVLEKNLDREDAFSIARERIDGRPLQYLLGEQYFYGRKFFVDANVLIPRPETEGLVEHCLANLVERKRGLEIGVGSGAISVTLLAERKDLKMVATELASGALDVAIRNYRTHLGDSDHRLSMHRVRSDADVLDSWLELKAPAFDFLISNPPYLIGTNEAEKQVDEHEPASALYAPKNDPLYFYDQIAKKAPELLNSKGMVFLEIPHERADEILTLFRASGFKSKLEKDLNQRARYLIGEIQNG